MRGIKIHVENPQLLKTVLNSLMPVFNEVEDITLLFRDNSISVKQLDASHVMLAEFTHPCDYDGEEKKVTVDLDGLIFALSFPGETTFIIQKDHMIVEVKEKKITMKTSLPLLDKDYYFDGKLCVDFKTRIRMRHSELCRVLRTLAGYMCQVRIRVDGNNVIFTGIGLPKAEITLNAEVQGEDFTRSRYDMKYLLRIQRLKGKYVNLEFSTYLPLKYSVDGINAAIIIAPIVVE